MLEILFKQDFATKKKGERLVCDSILANSLVRVKKVAEYYKEPVKPEKKPVKKPVEKTEKK